MLERPFLRPDKEGPRCVGDDLRRIAQVPGVGKRVEDADVRVLADGNELGDSELPERQIEVGSEESRIAPLGDDEVKCARTCLELWIRTCIALYAMVSPELELLVHALDMLVAEEDDRKLCCTCSIDDRSGLPYESRFCGVLLVERIVCSGNEDIDYEDRGIFLHGYLSLVSVVPDMRARTSSGISPTAKPVELMRAT